MELDLFGDVNWLAVVVSGFIYFVLGAVWFAPGVLGGPWRDAIGWHPDEEPGPTPLMIAGPLVTCLIAAVAVGVIGQATGADGLGQGLVLGLVLGIGLAGTVLGVSAAVEPKMPKPWNWFLVTGSYHLVGLLIVAGTVSVWN